MSAFLGNFLWLVLAMQGSVTAPPPPPDLEVFGRLQKNLECQLIEDPDDILGHCWVTARFRISRVIRGRAPSLLITIRYLAHTYRLEDRLIRLRLRANSSGTYIVCAEPGGEGLRCG